MCVDRMVHEDERDEQPDGLKEREHDGGQERA